MPKGAQDEAPTTLSNQESKCGEGPFMGSARSLDFVASDTLSQVTGPHEVPRIGQKLGQEFARLFMLNRAQEEAPTTLSNQESDCGEGPSRGSTKSPDFEASDTLSQATRPQEDPRMVKI